MTIAELKNVLEREHVWKYSVSFHENDPEIAETAICVRKQKDGRFLYFVRDRNDYFDHKEYKDENALCMDILNDLKWDYPSLKKYIN